MLWQRAKPRAVRRAVAYYRHSAQDRQENSVEIQQDQVRKFAADNGIEIVREFADRGKSGLSVEGRDEFNTMLRDYVQGCREDFQFVLVLDVSRWGRFQETDLSAYYTGLCLQHGKQVVFTTIGFPKENDLLHGLHLSIERYRAASYSRELSGKVWKGCAKIASGGFWAGGSAPYGMCRVLLDEARKPLQVLGRGDHKAIHNQRVTLGPGDKTEVEVVRHVFVAFARKGETPDSIAAALNARGTPAPGAGTWSKGTVLAMLQNEVYAGVMVWNKTSQKMKSKSRPNPRQEWVRADHAFASIISVELFELARQRIASEQAERAKRFSSEDMIERLRGILDRYGTVRGSLLAATPGMVSASTYASRFGSMDRAYQGIFDPIIRERRAQIVEDIRRTAASIESCDDFFVVDNYFSLAIQPTMPMPVGYEAAWTFHPDQRAEVDMTIGVPLSGPSDLTVLGYLLFPRILFRRKVSIHSGTADNASLYMWSLPALMEQLRR